MVECNTPYSILVQEDRNFTVGWYLSNGTDIPDEMSLLDKAYLFHSMLELRGLPFVGIMATYGGGGYNAELGLSLLKAIRYLGKYTHIIISCLCIVKPVFLTSWRFVKLHIRVFLATGICPLYTNFKNIFV